MYFGFVIGRCQLILFVLAAIHCRAFLSADAGKMVRAHLQICFLTVGVFAVSCK